MYRILVLLSFLLFAAPAHAGPLVAAVAAIGTAISSVAAASPILGLVIRTVIGLGISLLMQTLTKQNNKPKPAGSVLDIKMGDDQPMTFPVGSRAVAGRRKYIGTWGSADGTPNAYLVDVIEISSLPSYAGPFGLTSVWIDQQKCGVLWDQPDPDGRGYPIQQYLHPNGTPYGWIKYYDGTQTAADPYLVAKFGSHPDRPYTPDRVGYGIQYVVLTWRIDTDLNLGGSPPEGLFEPHPTPFYDPRKDSTNGGNGGHRYGDWSTYEPTLNPIVIAYNICRGIYYTPEEWVFGGQNVAAHRLPISAWFAAMNECDRNVNGVAQFRCGFEISCDQKATDIIEDLRLACAGRLAEVGGMIKPLVGAPGAAVYSFTDETIVVTSEQDFDPFPSLTQTYNRIAGTYPEPDQRWAMTDAPEQRNLDQEAADGNRSLAASVSFDAVPYSAQVQQLMNTMAIEQRRFRTHTFGLPPEAWALEPNDVVSWTSARNDYSEKKFLVSTANGGAGLLQRLSLKEIDGTDYDPPTIIVAPPTGWIGPITAPSQPMTGWNVEPDTVKDPGGIDRRPAIKISSAQNLDDVRAVWVQVRLKATGDLVFDSDSNPYAAPNTGSSYSWLISGDWMLSNTDYEARGRYLPYSNRPTDWSGWLEVTTPNILIQAGDVLDGAIIASKIADAAVTAEKIMDEAVTNLKLADAAVSTAKIEVAAVTAQVLADQAVISSKLADAAVTAAKLASQAIDATKFASNIEPIGIVTDTDLPTTKSTSTIVWNGKLYRWDGTEYTAAVQSTDITGQIESSQLADLAVTAGKIADGSIDAAKLAAESVDTSKLADGAVSADKLANEAIDATKLANSIKAVETVDTLPTTGNTEGRMVYLTTDGKLYRYTGSAFTAAVASTDMTGQITSTQITDGAISAPKLAANSVTAAAIAANAITAGAIAVNAVTTGTIAAGAVTATQIAAGAITAGKLTITDTTNYVLNPSFDGGISDGWYFNKPANNVVVPAANAPAINPPSQYVLTMLNDGTGSSIAYGCLPFAAAPGDIFYFEAWVAGPGSGTSTLRLGIGYTDANGAGESYQFPVVLSASSALNVWVKFSGQVTIPATLSNGSVPSKCRFVAVIPSGTGKWGITNVRMRKATTSELIVDGAITATKIAAGAVTATTIAAGTITADKMVLGDFTNRVENPNFAQGDVSWAKTAVTIASDPANAYIGNFYMNVGATGFAGIVSRNNNIFPVAPGETYFLQAFAKAFGGTNANIQVRIRYLGADKTTLIGTLAVTYTPADTTYVERNVVGTVPAGAVFAWVDVVTISGITTGAYAVGFVSVQRQNAANLIVDGAITATKIAANAVAAANIAAGAITTDKLAVGSGGNFLPNSDFSAGLANWSYEYSNGAGFTVSYRTDTYAPTGGAMQIFCANNTQGIEYGVGPGIASVNSTGLLNGQVARYSCVAGQWFEFSGYYLGLNSNGLQPYMGFFDKNGAAISYPNAGILPAAQNIDPQFNLANYQRFWFKAQAPAGAVTCVPFLRHKGTLPSQANSYIFLTRLYFGEANANQSQPSPWSPQGITMVSGGNVITGAITADKIAANTVTAAQIAADTITGAQIAAGAISASEIAADAITAVKLASNSVTTDALAVGSGKNLLQNAGFTMGMDCWAISFNSGPIPSPVFRIRAVTETWAGPNCPTLMLSFGAPSGNNYYSDVQWLRPDAPTLPNSLKYGVPCAPGDWFEVSAYVSAHRCLVELRLQWIGSDGLAVGYTTANQINNIPGSSTNPDTWTRLRCVGAAPANAVAVGIHIRKFETMAGQTDSYMFLNKPMLCRCPANASEFTPWSDGGVVMITNGGIVADSITADKIATNAVTADSIAANAVTAGKIAAGAVTATTIAAATITGDKLAANSIGATQIAADSITAKQLVLTDYSNMADNGWQAGNLDGWTLQNYQNFYIDNNQGDASGWLYQSIGREQAASNWITCSAGETYAFDVWVYNTDTTRAAVIARLLTPGGVYAYPIVVYTDLKSQWVRLQGKYTVPSGYNRICMDLFTDRTAGAGTQTYWSKPVMRRAVSAELIVDGAVTANKISVNSLDALTANLGAVNISSAVIGSLQVGTSNISGGAVTAVGAGRVAGTQTIGANVTANLVSCVVNVAGDGRVVIDAMTLGQFNQNGGSQNSQPIGCNIFRDGVAIFSQTYYLSVVQTVVTTTGGSNPSTSQATYTAGLVAVSGLYDAPGAGNHTYILQIYCPGNTIGWNESNITATALKR